MRYQGGSNAGHTLVIDGVKTKLSLVPSGILRRNTQCLIAAGVVIHPQTFVEEMRATEPDEIGYVITCGSGTYIRSIARDIGALLGCGGAVKTLRRTKSAPFTISDAVTIDKVTSEDIKPVDQYSYLQSESQNLCPL